MKQVKYDPIYKYIQCDCDKKQTIQLGWEYILYLHSIMIIFAIGLSLISVIALFKGPIDWRGLFFPGFSIMIGLLFWLGYRNCFNDMQRAGHTKACSKKVAWKAMWRQWRYSHYEIDVEVIKRPSRPEHRAASVAVLLWIMTIAINLVFILRYNYEDATSIVYPILFIFSITLSTLLVIKTKVKNKWLTVICVLNIISSSFMLSLYILNIIAKNI